MTENKPSLVAIISYNIYETIMSLICSIFLSYSLIYRLFNCFLVNLKFISNNEIHSLNTDVVGNDSLFVVIIVTLLLWQIRITRGMKPFLPETFSFFNDSSHKKAKIPIRLQSLITTTYSNQNTKRNFEMPWNLESSGFSTSSPYESTSDDNNTFLFNFLIPSKV